MTCSTCRGDGFTVAARITYCTCKACLGDGCAHCARKGTTSMIAPAPDPCPSCAAHASAEWAVAAQRSPISMIGNSA